MGRNWAITIGINGYRNLQRLHYAKQDADAVRQLFLQELGFQHVYHFTDDSPPIPQDYGPALESRPTYTTLLRFLRVRFETPFLRDGDNLWCFFAGHGIRNQNRDYLMPIDGDRGDIERTAIPIHDLSERLRHSGADNIILFIDACRSFEGRRDGVGLGLEKQQGVITLFSCSPEESAYEIEELQQGAFTYVLLESLRRQGEGNCATVERLYQQLCYYVPQVTQRYKRVAQTPYGVIEPPTKNHLILLPRQATLADIETLKKDALTAEVQGDARRAKQYWVRVLAVSPADPEAIEGIERLSRQSPQAAPPVSPTSLQPPEPMRVMPRSVSLSPRVSPRPQPAAPASPQPLPRRSASASPRPSSNAGDVISRRRVIQILGFTGGGIGTVFIGRSLLQSFSNTSAEKPAPVPALPPEVSFTPAPLPSLFQAPSLTSADFTAFQFEVVTVNSTGDIATKETKEAQAFQEAIGDSFIDMVAVSGGPFTMGSPDSEPERANDEGPQRDVNVPSFLMGKYSVTQAQWKAVAALPKVGRDLKADPARFKGANRPVEQVSWEDAVEFCQRLSTHTGRTYRLPSEAEWEYACRAGTTTPFHFGETITPEIANYAGSSTYGNGPKGVYRQETTEVGSFQVANAFGLYDMHGNVWEWCLDPWHESYAGAPSDGSAWDTDGDAPSHVLRGGSWSFNPGYCRSANRNWGMPDSRGVIGFRVVCSSVWTL